MEPFEGIPAVEIGCRGGLPEALPKLRRYAGRCLKTHERQLFGVEHRLDRRDPERMFLDMEEQVAKPTAGKEVVRHDTDPALDHLLPAAADVIGQRAVSSLRDERVRRLDRAPR